MDVEGFKVPHGYYLHNGHTWVKIEEGSSVRIGIDDFALSLLGPLDRVEAPLMGKVVRQGAPDVAVTRGPHQAKLLSPLSGVITAVNAKLREEETLPIWIPTPRLGHDPSSSRPARRDQRPDDRRTKRPFPEQELTVSMICRRGVCTWLPTAAI
jgi:glycine cleavage system H lipoate-binding protein